MDWRKLPLDKIPFAIIAFVTFIIVHTMWNITKLALEDQKRTQKQQTIEAFCELITTNGGDCYKGRINY